jgi:DNA-binding NarL/FixJ family response regulator
LTGSFIGVPAHFFPMLPMDWEEDAMSRVLIAEDHPLFRDALRGILGQILGSADSPFEAVETGTIDELLAVVEADDGFDLVMLDLFMPGAQGLSHLVTMRARLPDTPIIVFSSVSDSKAVRQTITCGAAGFISKSATREEIAQALGVVMGGGVYLPPRFKAELDAAALRPRARWDEDEDRGKLTGRQVAVLELVAAGKANKQIAYELGISEITVKTHVTAILHKLRVSSRGQAIVMFQKRLVEDAISL